MKKEYEFSKSHTGKGYCIYRKEKPNFMFPLIYLKETKNCKRGEFEKIINSLLK
jgi:hypothetical protein